MKKLSVLSLAALAAACSSAAPFVVTGESLRVLGSQFIATAALMDASLDDGTITQAQYRVWRDFGIKFQAAYPLAVDGWELARRTNDFAAEKKYAAAIADLAIDLGRFYEGVRKITKPDEGR